MCEKELQHKLCDVGDVDAESGSDINTPQKNDSNILTAKMLSSVMSNTQSKKYPNKLSMKVLLG